MPMQEYSCSLDKILIVWDSKGVGMKRAIQVIESLQSHFRLQLCVLEEDICDIYENGLELQNGTYVIDMEDLLFDTSLILLPMVSDALLHDLEIGNTENLIVNVIMEALCKEIPVKVLASVRESLSGKGAGVISYKNKRRQIFHTFGIDIIDGEETEIKVTTSSIPKNSDYIITEEDILQFVNDEINEVHLKRGGLITPLARDTAKKYGMKLIE